MSSIRRLVVPAFPSRLPLDSVRGPLLAVALVVAALSAAPARAQLGEWGDAPEGNTAYPFLGIGGNFPTCVGGPAGFIQHAPNPPGMPNCWFGPNWDLEGDGNAGFCPPPPHNQDECFIGLDNDAGLVIVTSWTIDPTQTTEVPCNTPGPPVELPPPCTTAAWGTDIDMLVHNTLGVTAYVNVLADWNQDGRWNFGQFCGPDFVPEWIIQDLPVPPFYVGSLQGLAAPAFRIGANSGSVWFRFVISVPPVIPVYGLGWDGGGMFDHGETEDHLIRVEPASTIGEYGDAPEEALAYPAAGTMGAFPSCRVIGPSGFVFHAASGALFFGPTVDYETDGDAGTCAWPDYDEDECGPQAGGDAGLIQPGAYTIDPGLNIVPCGSNTRPLGGVCQLATIGFDLDIDIQNGIGQDAYLNVLIDWNMDGQWAGTSACALFGTTDEHLVQNVVVPAGFSGPMSQLTNASFIIPTGPGTAWARFTLSDAPVAVGWNGAGSFGEGETEDYLFVLDGPGLGEYGDAPEGSMAYPSLGVVGDFPTCALTGSAGSVYHRAASGERIGPSRDLEGDGNAGPPCAFPGWDSDECGAQPGGDSGLLAPDAFTIHPALGTEVPCQPNAVRPLGTPCGTSAFGADLDIDVTNPLPFDLYFNLLVDWNQDGRWNGASACPLAQIENEHLVQNLVVPPFYSGAISGLLAGATFLVPGQPGYVWTRATLGDSPVAVDWDGAGLFTYGETEDYLLYIASTSEAPESAPPAPHGLRLGPAAPNPSRGEAVVHFVLPAAGAPRLSIFDVAGRRVAGADLEELPAGAHRWSWDGRDAAGRVAPAGVYVVRLEAAGEVRTLKILRQP